MKSVKLLNGFKLDNSLMISMAESYAMDCCGQDRSKRSKIRTAMADSFDNREGNCGSVNRRSFTYRLKRNLKEVLSPKTIENICLILQGRALYLQFKTLDNNIHFKVNGCFDDYESHTDMWGDTSVFAQIDNLRSKL